MFKALQTAGNTLKPSKVQCRLQEVEHLRHILTADAIRICEDRVKATVDLPTPKTVKQMRSVPGLVNFVRKFIPNLAGTIAPLVTLTKKEAIKEVGQRWGPEHDIAYAKVKQLIVQAPVLQFPDFAKDLAIHVYASKAGVGAILAQQKTDDRVITGCLVNGSTIGNGTTLLRKQRMFRGWASNTALAALFMGTAFGLRHRSCDREISLPNSGNIEHVYTLSNYIAILWLHRTA